MGNTHATMFRESTIPGLSTIFSSRSYTRRMILMIVFIILILLTLKDLISIVTDYFTFPITVSVLVTESRVLPFPAVTVCNLNPVHRGRFCSADIQKPENIRKILCASLIDLFEVCKITEALEELVTDGRQICEGKSNGKRTSGRGGRRGLKRVRPRPAVPSNTTKERVNIRNNRNRSNSMNNETISNNNITILESPAFPSMKLPVPRGKPVSGVVPMRGSGNIFPRRPQRGNVPNTLPGTASGVVNVLTPNLNPLTRRIIKNKVKAIEKNLTETFSNTTSSLTMETRSTRKIEKLEEESSEDDEEDLEDDDDSLPDSFEMRPGMGRCPFQSSLMTRHKRESGDIKFNLRTLMATFKSLQAGNFSGGLLQPLTESGGIIDMIILQIAQFYGINVNSTRDLLPALFLRAFTQVTGCSVGQASSTEGAKPNPVNEALDNLTTIFQNTGCIWKAPKLVKLFQATSERLIGQLTSCTGPWVNELLGYNASSESAQEGQTPWYILLELLENWLADLSRTDPEKAMKIGHQPNDLIKYCVFAGKKCDIDRDFKTTFYSQHGNCFTYSMDSGEAMKESMSGFTGPKFGLELLFNLEKDQYMPTSREAGVKIMVHDRSQKADPDQDAINISPGVVTYVGVQMMNISRLTSPYPDECMDEWPTGFEEAVEYKKWADALNHDSYTIQVCLKICLQLYTIKMCKCWTSSALWPPYPDIPECATKSKDAEECVDVVRHLYYEEKIKCHCPPRCTDRIYERFLSTGQETRQCSAIQSETQQTQKTEVTMDSSGDDKENSAKVIVYFHSLTFNEINQQKKYTMEGLLGAIGGILGVYLGISFFAIFEFFEVMVRGSCFGLTSGRERNAQDERDRQDRHRRERHHRRDRDDPERSRRDHDERRRR